MRRLLNALVLIVAGCLLLLPVELGCSRCGSDEIQSDHPIAEAWEHFRLGEFKPAEAIFEAVRQSPDCRPADRIDATYGLATVCDLRTPMTDQDKALAAKLYQRVIDADPNGRLAPWSMLALARMQHLVPVGHEPDYPAVCRAYQKVWQTYPESQAGQEAFIYLQETYVRNLDPKDVQQAVVQLKQFIAEHPHSKLIYAAWSLLEEAYAIEGKPDERLQAEIKALETHEVDPSNPFVENSWSYWKIAVTAEFEVGDFDLARKYYRKLLDEYPQDLRCYSCEEALQRMDAVEKRLQAKLDGKTAP